MSGARIDLATTDHSCGQVQIIQPGRVSKTLDESRASVWKGLTRPLPTIEPKYFYDDRGSQLFEEITRLPEYYQTRTEEALLETIADTATTLCAAHELVELGSGACRKIHLLLDSLQRKKTLRGCTLLDVNKTFLETSARRLAADYPGLAVRGVVGDFMRDTDAFGTGSHRLFVFLAGTIGNIHPHDLPDFLRGMRSVLDSTDAFLVGLDLVKDTRRLEAAYNDSAGVTAQFNLNILRVLNHRFGTDFEVEDFEHVAFYDPEREWIEMRLRALRPTSVSMGPETGFIRFGPGDEIRTEISCKFTRLSFVETLFGTGLEVWRWWTDPEELFALALLRPC